MIYLILGRREMGKSTLALHMARSCPKRVIFDPRCQFDGAGPDSVQVSSGLLLDEAFDDLTRDDSGIKEVIVAPTRSTQDLYNRTCSHVLTWAQADPVQPLAFLIDEVTFVDLMKSEDFEWIVRAAPRRSIHILITGHRPKDVDVNVRALADEWLMFRMVQSNDLEVIDERCSAHVADQVRVLDPYWYMQWDDAHGEAYKHPPLTGFVPFRQKAGPDAQQLAIGKGILLRNAQGRLPET